MIIFSSKRKSSKEPISTVQGEIRGKADYSTVLSVASVRSSGGSTPTGHKHQFSNDHIKDTTTEIIDVPEDYIEEVTGAAMPAGGLSSTN